jgi:paraquat-inducible protein B
MARRGPLISITFKTADGLTAQQTKVKHKAVDLGTVEDIALSPDMSHVSVRVRMDGRAAPLLTDRARFWVVRPRFASGNLAGIASGLETLVSGAYIEIDPGQPPGREARTFTGLEDPPGDRSDEPGHLYVLHAEQLGSLTAGAPVSIAT